MATFKPVIRKEREDGMCAVYIRVMHNGKPGYIKTDKIIPKDGISASGDVKDKHVAQYCMRKILEYSERLNSRDIRLWKVSEVVSFLRKGQDDICFSAYAREYIKKMIIRGEERNAKNYNLALGSLELFLGTNQVMFGHLTSATVNKWIDSLMHTRRAKEMYPVCLRQVFKQAVLDFNDYDTGDIRITTNPWVKVKIPSSDRPEKLAVSPEEVRRFFASPLPPTKQILPLSELGRDVAMMILCLAGINTIDIYNLKKQDYSNGIIHYQRAKTKKSRRDGAYIEMRVPQILLPIFDKYLNHDRDDSLFVFNKRNTTADSFNASVNTGIRQICEYMGMKKEDWYSAYTFRHTWGTVAQNDCGASIADVAFAMNHSHGFTVTRGYLKLDFSPAWELNEKVVDFLFFTDKPSSREPKQEQPGFKLSFRYMVEGAAYYQGRKLAEVMDIGFNNIDSVVERLVSMLPDTIPNHAIVLFKITNIDKDQTVVVQRQKGKGF